MGCKGCRAKSLWPPSLARPSCSTREPATRPQIPAETCPWSRWVHAQADSSPSTSLKTLTSHLTCAQTGKGYIFACVISAARHAKGASYLHRNLWPELEHQLANAPSVPHAFQASHACTAPAQPFAAACSNVAAAC